MIESYTCVRKSFGYVSIAHWRPAFDFESCPEARRAGTRWAAWAVFRFLCRSAASGANGTIQVSPTSAGLVEVGRIDCASADRVLGYSANGLTAARRTLPGRGPRFQINFR
jgi:hypothetical protein